jgi:hypothetical protein
MLTGYYRTIRYIKNKNPYQNNIVYSLLFYYTRNDSSIFFIIYYYYLCSGTPYTGTKRASNRKEKTSDWVCFCTTPVVRYLFEKSVLKSGGNILVVTVEKHRLVAK